MFYQIIIEKKLQLLIDVLEVITWPLTLLIILLVFRKYFISAMSRLGSIEAGASGLTMTFDQKISQAKKLLKEIKPISIAKSSTDIKIKVSKSASYSKLMDIKMELNSVLINLGNENNISIENKTTSSVCDELKEVGILTIQTAKLIESLIDITISADVSFTENHLKVAEELLKAINSNLNI
jgi:hypothetical protein